MTSVCCFPMHPWWTAYYSLFKSGKDLKKSTFGHICIQNAVGPWGCNVKCLPVRMKGRRECWEILADWHVLRYLSTGTLFACVASVDTLSRSAAPLVSTTCTPPLWPGSLGSACCWLHDSASSPRSWWSEQLLTLPMLSTCLAVWTLIDRIHSTCLKKYVYLNPLKGNFGLDLPSTRFGKNAFCGGYCSSVSISFA